MKNIIFLFGLNETEIGYSPEKYPSYLHPPPPSPNWILAVVIFIAPPLGRIHASEFLNRLDGVTDKIDTTQTPNQLRKLCRGSPVDFFI